MTDDYYYMPNAYLSYWSGSGVTTDQMHNGVTMGASGDMVADICVRVTHKAQIKKRTRSKKSGFSAFRTTEGMLEPTEFTLLLKTNSLVPLSWVHGSDSDAATPKGHTFVKPLIQQPHISATATTAIPALAFRIERESATNALQRVDLLGCVLTELKLTGEDGGKFQWEAKGLADMVLAGVAEITSPVADPTTVVFGWEHFAVSAFTYNSQTVAFTPKTLTVTWTLEWQPIVPAYKATTYFVYTNWLLKSWDVEIEMRGLPYEDGTKSSIFTIARTAVASYATALLFTFTMTRTAVNDFLSYSIDKWELEIDNYVDSERESSGYEERTITLKPAEGSALTAAGADALAAAYYGGAT